MTTDGLWIAADGPVTSLVEDGAAAVGSGVVLGGFFAGFILGLLLCRRDVDRGVMLAGYAGGALGLLAFVFDRAIG